MKLRIEQITRPDVRCVLQNHPFGQFPGDAVSPREDAEWIKMIESSGQCCQKRPVSSHMMPETRGKPTGKFIDTLHVLLQQSPWISKQSREFTEGCAREVDLLPDAFDEARLERADELTETLFALDHHFGGR